MNLMSLAPMLLPGIMPRVPAPLMKVGLKVMMSGQLFKQDGSIDADAAIRAVIKEVKDSDEVARLLVSQGVKMLGYSDEISQYVASFIYDAPDGERSDDEIKELSTVLKEAKMSTVNGFQLPFACIECNRIHVTNNFKLSPSNKPICLRCGRELDIKRI